MYASICMEYIKLKKQQEVDKTSFAKLPSLSQFCKSFPIKLVN